MPRAVKTKATKPPSAFSISSKTRSPHDATRLSERRSPGTKAKSSDMEEKTAAELEWTRQYFQGKSITDLPGCGCGSYTFGTRDYIPFKSPYNGLMRVEVMDGSTNPSSGGCIRLCGPETWHGSLDTKVKDKREGEAPTFLVPFSQIETILARPSTADTKSVQSFTITVIPTGAVGLSSLKRELPAIIEFELPDRQKDEGLHGSISEAERSQENETYLAAFTAACNKQLSLFGRRVILLDDETRGHISCKTTWERDEKSNLGDKGKDKGTLHLLPRAIFFESSANKKNGTPRHVYVPIDPATDGRTLAESLMLVLDKQGDAVKRISLWLLGVKDSPIWPPKVAPSDRPRKVLIASYQDLLEGNVELVSGDEYVPERDMLCFIGLPMKMLTQLQRFIEMNYLSAADQNADKVNCDPKPQRETRNSKKRKREEQASKPFPLHFKVVDRFWFDFSKGWPLSGLVEHGT